MMARVSGSRIRIVVPRPRGVPDALDQRLVDLGVAPTEDQSPVLAEIGPDVADHALDPSERRTDRHHPQRQGALAHPLDEPHHLALRLEQALVADRGRPQTRAHLGDHELADQVDELVETARVDPNALPVVRCGRRCRRHRGCRALEGRRQRPGSGRPGARIHELGEHEAPGDEQVPECGAGESIPVQKVADFLA